MIVPGSANTDQQRFEDWVSLYGPRLRGYLLVQVRRHDTADDLVQEVFRRAWQKRESYRETGQARAYLFRIADRLLIDHFRRTGREDLLDETGWQIHEPHQDTPPSESLERRERSEELQRALAGLTPAQRRVLLLRFYGELSFAEIAESLAMPLGTVLSHCRRGLVALRETLPDPAPCEGRP